MSSGGEACGEEDLDLSGSCASQQGEGMTDAVPVVHDAGPLVGFMSF